MKGWGRQPVWLATHPVLLALFLFLRLDVSLGQWQECSLASSGLHPEWTSDAEVQPLLPSPEPWGWGGWVGLCGAHRGPSLREAGPIVACYTKQQLATAVLRDCQVSISKWHFRLPKDVTEYLQTFIWLSHILCSLAHPLKQVGYLPRPADTPLTPKQRELHGNIASRDTDTTPQPAWWLLTCLLAEPTDCLAGAAGPVRPRSCAPLACWPLMSTVGFRPAPRV